MLALMLLGCGSGEWDVETWGEEYIEEEIPADVFEDGSGSAEVRAFNCVYHHLAQDHPQVCEFDLELMARVSGRRVDHVECMVRGGQCCRFRLTGTTDSQSRTAS